MPPSLSHSYPYSLRKVCGAHMKCWARAGDTAMTTVPSLEELGPVRKTHV